ncbi:MAG: MoaD/ThiS family protein [Gemmatimonadota bacterium]|nr:MoaD/ThiS family protein [Gemmatimonadota bacterium]
MPVAAPSTVTVHVLLFASYAEGLGFERRDLTLSAPASIGTVLDQLRRLPGGEQLPAKPLCARNLAHADREEAVVHGDEIAILPPLAGG